MIYLIPTILFLILFSWLAFKNFKIALALFVFLFPTYLIRFNIGPLPTTMLEVMFGILFVIWLWQFIKESKSFNKGKLFYPGLLLIAAAGISVFWSSNTMSALGILKAYFIEPFLFYLILINSDLRKKDWIKLFLSLGATTVVLSLIAVTQRVTGWWSPEWMWLQEGSRRVTGLYTSPNALGLFVGPITALYLAWLIIEPRLSNKLDWFRNIVVASGVLSILLAVSKGALAALISSILLLLFFLWSKKKVLVIFAVTLLVLFSVPQTRNLIQFQTDSGQSRIGLYAGTTEYLKEHPIKGMGLASFNEKFEEYRPKGFTEDLIYPHNFFLNFWVETGLLGLIAVLWMVVLIVKEGGKSNLKIKWLAIAPLLVILLHGLIDVSYFKNDLAMLTWFFLALFNSVIIISDTSFLND